MRWEGEEIHIWYARPGNICNLDALLSLLDTNEQSRLRAYRRENDRNIFLLARAMLRTSLSHYEAVDPADWRFVTGINGRPYIANNITFLRPLHFSISHTYGLAAVAIGHTEWVGIDVEKTEHQLGILEIAPIVMTKLELELLTQYPESARLRLLLRHWSLKEAFSKACSLGLSLPFDQIGFELHGPSPQLEINSEVLIGNFSGWRFVELELGPTHVGALAANRCTSLHLHEWLPKT